MSSRDYVFEPRSSRSDMQDRAGPSIRDADRSDVQRYGRSGNRRDPEPHRYRLGREERDIYRNNRHQDGPYREKHRRGESRYQDARDDRNTESRNPGHRFEPYNDASNDRRSSSASRSAPTHSSHTVRNARRSTSPRAAPPAPRPYRENHVQREANPPPPPRSPRDSQPLPPSSDVQNNTPTKHDEQPRVEHEPGALEDESIQPPNEITADPDTMDAMAAMMGFGGFGTTKGQKVAGNDAGAAEIKKERTWRQYMNRKGGFNRPLDKIK